uniref:Integrase core domain containing protein n=1 Tax=Solanum tuberosum TaxID=4113 RepID=M1DBG1_SOLTU
MRGHNMLMSCIPAQSHSPALILASQHPPLPMPLAPERLMTRWAYPCTPFFLAPSKTCGVSMASSNYIMMGRTGMSKRARPGPLLRSIGYLQTELARLRADVDALLDPAESVPEPAPEVEKDEVVISALFGETMPPSDTSRAAGKCHHSSVLTSDMEEARRVKKKEREAGS